MHSVPTTLIPNTHHRRRRDATRQLRRVGVGGVYWALRYKDECPCQTPETLLCRPTR